MLYRSHYVDIGHIVHLGHMKPTKEELKNLIKSHSQKEIAHLKNVSERTVRRWLAEYGLLKKRLGKATAKEIRQLYYLGESTQQELADAYNVSKSTIHKILHNKSYPEPSISFTGSAVVQFRES